MHTISSLRAVHFNQVRFKVPHQAEFSINASSGVSAWGTVSRETLPPPPAHKICRNKGGRQYLRSYTNWLKSRVKWQKLKQLLQYCILYPMGLAWEG